MFNGKKPALSERRATGFVPDVDCSSKKEFLFSFSMLFSSNGNVRYSLPLQYLVSSCPYAFPITCWIFSSRMIPCLIFGSKPAIFISPPRTTASSGKAGNCSSVCPLVPSAICEQIIIKSVARTTNFLNLISPPQPNQ